MLKILNLLINTVIYVINLEFISILNEIIYKIYIMDFKSDLVIG